MILTPCTLIHSIEQLIGVTRQLLRLSPMPGTGEAKEWKTGVLPQEANSQAVETMLMHLKQSGSNNKMT